MFPRCDSCRAIVAGNGVYVAGGVYCSTGCYRKGYLTELAKLLPTEEIDNRVKAVYEGKCPECGGKGPVDVHHADYVYSLLVVSVRSSEPKICCRVCARQRQLKAAWVCAWLGWWGLFGLIATPIAIYRNLSAMRKPDAECPSRALRESVMLQLAAEVAEAGREARRRERREARDQRTSSELP